MQLSYDAQLIVLGAIIGLVSSLLTSIITALFQSWLNRREYIIRQRWEKEEKLKEIYIPTREEVERIIAETHAMKSGKYHGVANTFEILLEKTDRAKEELRKHISGVTTMPSGVLRAIGEIEEIKAIWKKRYSLFRFKSIGFVFLIGIIVFLLYLAVVFMIHIV